MDDTWLAPQPEPIITYLTAHTHPALNTFHLSSLKAQRGSLISVTSPFGSRQTSLDYNGRPSRLKLYAFLSCPKKTCQNFVDQMTQKLNRPSVTKRRYLSWLYLLRWEYHKICVLRFICSNLRFKARETVGHNELKSRKRRNLFNITSWSKLRDLLSCLCLELMTRHDMLDRTH